jgi:hypothetical protein
MTVILFPCPAVHLVKDQCGIFSPRIVLMHQLMWQTDIVSVVCFVAECLDILQIALSAAQQP